MAKLADAPDLGSGGAILRGSSPLLGKYLKIKDLCRGGCLDCPNRLASVTLKFQKPCAPVSTSAGVTQPGHNKDQRPLEQLIRRQHACWGDRSSSTPAARAVCCLQSSEIRGSHGPARPERAGIPECFLDTVFDDPAFKVNRLPGRWRQLHASDIFDHPSYFGEVLPRPFSRSTGRLQFVQHATAILSIFSTWPICPE